MKKTSSLPKVLVRMINRLANEEARAATLARGRALRDEYAMRLQAGEWIDDLEREVHERTLAAVVEGTTSNTK